MKIFIGIVNFNCSHFLKEQVDRIRKYLLISKGDELIFYIADNSRLVSESEAIKDICHQNNLHYVLLNFSEGDNSTHHALALNYLYNTYGRHNDIALFFDHDIFLFKECNFIEESENMAMLGLSQIKLGKTYLHPACLLINNKLLSEQIIDFTPAVGMDTGGKLWSIVEYFNKTNQIKFLSLKHIEFHNDFYEIIGDSYMHLIKGSNWSGNNNHETRVKYLMEELKIISE